MSLAEVPQLPNRRLYCLVVLVGMPLLCCPVLAGDGEAQQEESDTVVVETGEERIWKGEPISLSLKDADLVEVLRSFARLAGTNIVIDPGVKGSVTLELKDVPWDQAFYVILKTHGLGVDTDGQDVWAIARRGKTSQQQSAADD